MMLAVGIGVPNGVMRRSPAPAGFTATKLMTAAVAAPAGIPQPVALPPCELKSVPVTRKSRVVPPAMGPPARRVSMMRHGVTGVYTEVGLAVADVQGSLAPMPFFPERRQGRPQQGPQLGRIASTCSLASLLLLDKTDGARPGAVARRPHMDTPVPAAPACSTSVSGGYRLFAAASSSGKRYQNYRTSFHRCYHAADRAGCVPMQSAENPRPKEAPRSRSERSGRLSNTWCRESPLPRWCTVNRLKTKEARQQEGWDPLRVFRTVPPQLSLQGVRRSHP